ncbi:hypothetical protein ACWEPC_09175 [Nonomuraea sp. NPDC004297]
MNDFEDRLLAALKEDIATRTADGTTTPAPARTGFRRRRLAGLSAALAGVAAATVAVVVATGVAGSPAYAVSTGSGGEVSVRIHAFTDPEGLEAELAAAGIRAVVDYLPQGQTCRQPRGSHGAGSGKFTAGVGREGDGISFTIGKGQVPEGSTLVLAVSKSRDGDDRPPFATALEIVTGAVSECVPTPLPTPPPGGTSRKDSTGPGDDSGTEQGPSLTSRTG